MIILRGILINKIENINKISCLFNTINKVERGDERKLKNSHGAIIEAACPANFQFSPKTNINISTEKKYTIKNNGAETIDALMVNFLTIRFKLVFFALETS